MELLLLAVALATYVGRKIDEKFEDKASNLVLELSFKFELEIATRPSDRSQ